MAKKSMKKKAATKKSGPKTKSAKKKGGKGGTGKSAGPTKISSGAGMTPGQMGAELVRLYNAGKFAEVDGKWWSSDIESIEGGGEMWRGRAAVEGKCAWWYEHHELLGASAEGPYVGATGFAVKFQIHAREKATGKELRMNEVGVYTVKNGKMIREEFMYGS